MPEQAALVERNSPIACEVGLDVRPRRDTAVQIDEARDFTFKLLHPLWKGVAQPLHDLKQRQIDVSESAAGDVAAVGLQYLLEIAEIFRHPLLPELLGALFCRRALVLEVEAWPERMMGVVNFQHEIGDRKLQLMHPQPCCFRFRRKPMPRAEIKQDVGGLPRS